MPGAGRSGSPDGARLRQEVNNEFRRMFGMIDTARSDIEDGLRYMSKNKDSLTEAQRRDAVKLQKVYLKTDNSQEAYKRKWLERAGQWQDGELSQPPGRAAGA